MSWLNDLSIERKRIKATQDAVSPIIRPLAIATPRRLVQVYTGGVLPTCAPCYYLGHPVELDGAETEGASATTTVDTANSIPFVLVRGNVSVGDILPIHAIGGRWAAEKFGCTTTICVTCSGVAVSGASVTISSGGTTISSGTTGGGGCVTLPIPAAGSYTVAVTSGSGNSTGSVSLACGGTTTIEVCGFPCGSCYIPRQNLTVDYTNIILGNGSTTLVYSGAPTTQWVSPCTNQLLYELVCSQNQVEFRVHYFVSGSCPGGQSQYCSTVRVNPFRLNQTVLSCSPFHLHCTVTSSSCPNLASNAYTDFDIHT